MSQATPPEDNGRRRLSHDELIALFVAFTTLGSVLFWGMSRTGLGTFRLLRSTAIQQNSDNVSLNGRHSWRTGEPGNREFAGSRLGLGQQTDEDQDDVAASSNSAINRMSARDEETQDTDRNTGDRVGSTAFIPAFLPNSDRTAIRNGTDLDRGHTDGPSSDNVTDINDNLPKQTAQPADIAPLEVAREALDFQDVPEGYWAKPYIDALSSRLLIQGFDEGVFKPEEPVNRAQLATLINEAFDLSDSEAAIAFNDLQAAEWAKEAIESSVKGGFMNGFPDKSFQPNLPVPRVQVLTALVTGLNTQAEGEVEAAISQYADVDKIPDWAVDKMAAATQAGLVVNYPDISQLAPNQSASRAEVAAMIYQALVYQGRIEPIPSEYWVKP